ncbi:TFIIB-type zinc ribbon-containing protein [Thermocoleostomius sinensis]|uniref:Zf-TFIIB domain-containing protein n=1 Tax=Thermocoleostomius sinensis A174 TaxID=2016057 RepID=A0A9E8ZBG7_9CYAN|nr:zf-TFIIB domain-containing protein [Thermocoleostomius sinensis]WAL60175.1 zf-TFIIB domain-containing protein [Thermocoleostomius sinensis A174]
MRCPKNKKIELLDDRLSVDLAVKRCPDCKGIWIPSNEYEVWQQRHVQDSLEQLPSTLNVDYVQSPLDAKAAFCPECHRYLARAKVAIKTPFYVERCSQCGGIWCDHGEWDVLTQLGLNTIVQQLFTSEWQARSKQREQSERERQATIDKLGQELADLVFELAERLEKHPNGDFGMAYLMRRFNP